MNAFGSGTNLPLQLTSFVGREREIADLRELVRRGRLVTIAGSSGMGKTRLAVEVAAEALPDMTGGVWFVSLSSLTEPALVPRLVAEALGARDEQREPVLESLAAHLAGQDALLVLDNCEHLIDSSARLAEELLRSTPSLRILATSHEPLRVPGETVWRIAPLEIAAGAEDIPAGPAAELESVRLFAARAASVLPAFRLDEQAALIVAQICRRLDGIPLAIELAAARTGMMSASELLERIEDRFRLLTGGMRTALPRHQTLRAALDWGHQLLEDPEQVLFRRLSVFAGGFDSAAVEAVCADPDLPASEVVAHLGRLVDKSMVVPDGKITPSGRTRYRMLETVREYASERLLESGEADRVRAGHTDHYLAVAERAQLAEFSAAQAAWLSRLEAEHENMRSALDWCWAHDAEKLMRLASALGWFWVIHGHLTEGRTWLDGAVGLTSLGPSERARAHLWQARLAFWLGDYPAAEVACEQSLALYRSVDDAFNAGWPASLMAATLVAAGRVDEGEALLEEVLESAVNDEVRLEANTSLGEARLQQGRFAEARGILEASIAMASGPAQEFRTATAVMLLGALEFFEGNPPAAREQLARAVDAFALLGHRYALAAALNVFAAVALAEGRLERALRLSAAAEHLRGSIQAQMSRPWRSLIQSVVVEPAWAAAGPRAPAAWAAGERMTLIEALADAQSDPRSEDSGRLLKAGSGSRLTRREVEVAMMVARGMTNRQIAERLHLAERTIEGHVERVRTKLGVRSRTQIAVWVVEQGWLATEPASA